MIIDSEINQIYELKLLHHQSDELLLQMCEVLPSLSFQQLENGMVIKAIIKAVKKGRVEFVTAILNACPELVWCVENSTERNIFMLAVLHRQDEVFRLLRKSLAKNSKFARAEKDSNKILHIAEMFEPSAGHNTVPGIR